MFYYILTSSWRIISTTAVQTLHQIWFGLSLKNEPDAFSAFLARFVKLELNWKRELKSFCAPVENKSGLSPQLGKGCPVT